MQGNRREWAAAPGAEAGMGVWRCDRDIASSWNGLFGVGLNWNLVFFGWAKSSWRHADSLAVACGFSCPVPCGILVPQPGIKAESPPLEGTVLTTQTLGKSFSYLNNAQ